jgi:putative transposase
VFYRTLALLLLIIQHKSLCYMMSSMNLTFHYKIKNFTGFLNGCAQKVNFIWNYCNDVQRQAVKAHRKWLSKFDLSHLTAGSSEVLELNSHTIRGACFEYAARRAGSKKPWLKWRSKKKSLGWVPVATLNLTHDVNTHTFTFMKHEFRVYEDRPLPGKICCGSNFSQDSRGRWFLNVVTEVEECPLRPGNKSVGIDLGLKDFATLSNGMKLPGPKATSKYARKLAVAQRANHAAQAKKIHQKIKDVRKDFHHKESTKIIKQFNNVAVGDVSPSKLSKTSLAKSVNDAGWSSFRSMLRYKALRFGATFKEVTEKYSTQTCHICGVISGPKGLAGLNKREWTCSDGCGATHDRDINAACNILAVSGMIPLQRELEKRNVDHTNLR